MSVSCSENFFFCKKLCTYVEQVKFENQQLQNSIFIFVFSIDCIHTCALYGLFDQSRACLELEASRRWAVTGTPIQNSLDDAAALLAFLRHEPWSDRGWWRRVIGDPYKVCMCVWMYCSSHPQPGGGQDIYS